MQKNVAIIKVEKNQLKELQNIGRLTFKETFSDSNNEKDLNDYLNFSFSDDKIKSELQNINSSFYFATIDNKIIGYLKINFKEAQTEIRNYDSMEIERIYVLNEYHGKKVGLLLLNKAIEEAKHTDTKFVWLGVWENNKKAISFYNKNGFKEFDKHIFKIGNDKQTDILMKLEIEKGE